MFLTNFFSASVFSSCINFAPMPPKDFFFNCSFVDIKWDCFDHHDGGNHHHGHDHCDPKPDCDPIIPNIVVNQDTSTNQSSCDQNADDGQIQDRVGYLHDGHHGHDQCDPKPDCDPIIPNIIVKPEQPSCGNDGGHHGHHGHHDHHDHCNPKPDCDPKPDDPIIPNIIPNIVVPNIIPNLAGLLSDVTENVHNCLSELLQNICSHEPVSNCFPNSVPETQNPSTNCIAWDFHGCLPDICTPVTPAPVVPN